MKKLFFLIILMTGTMVFMSMKKTGDKPYEIGEKVDDFQLQNIDNSWIQLSDYMGEEGAIIIFTCNTCPYAQLYEDRIIKMHERFIKMGFPVLAVNPNDIVQKPGDNFENMQKRASEKNFPYAYVLDENQEVYPKFGATNTPQVFLIDNNMQLRYSGAIDDNPQNPDAVKINYVENAIEAIMSEENPDPSRTKAIGCGIKAKKKMG
ncbi:MAG: thioredoxin family protein [Saprospiraceae bacterium]|nr:thioredoxin family protein [Saprospiraceae bacterium]